ncbi:MAG: FKBP-type peptidyl-prolyl cis-trans isomerase [Ilumatobacteraceae bacterium]
MAAAGWYPDPTGRFEFRYFDGADWSSSVSRAGQQFVDPPTGPSGPNAPLPSAAPSAPFSPGGTPGAQGAPGGWPQQGQWQPQAAWQAAPVPPKEGNGLAVTALVLGVLACVFGLIPFMFVLVFLLALLAIIFGLIGAGKRASGGRSKMAIAGLVLGFVGIAAGVVGVMITKVWVDNAADSLNDLFTTTTVEGGAETTISVPVGDLADSQPVTIQGDPLSAFTDTASDDAVGVLAPTITGASFDGTPITIDGRQTGPVMVVFLAHWCPHCNAEIPRLLEWKASGAMPDGLQVIGVSTAVSQVSPNYPPAEWLADKGWSWPVMADESDGDGAAGLAAQAFGATGWPYFVILGSDNQVLARSSGEMEISDLQVLVDGALAGDSAPSSPAPAEKPSVSVPAVPPTDLTVTPLIAGSGPGIEVGDEVSVHYVGVTVSDGEEFDNSYDRGEPATFTIGVGQLIEGWDVGLLGLQAGGRYQLDIPTAMAYGDDAAAQGRPAGALTFIVDIIAITPG